MPDWLFNTLLGVVLVALGAGIGKGWRWNALVGGTLVLLVAVNAGMHYLPASPEKTEAIQLAAKLERLVETGAYARLSNDERESLWNEIGSVRDRAYVNHGKADHRLAAALGPKREDFERLAVGLRALAGRLP